MITLLLLIVCIITNSVIADPWLPIDWRTLPIPDNDDTVQVRYLVAPLLEEKYGNFLASINAYHAALGFYSQNVSITINYDALDFVHSSLFPDIVDTSDGKVELKWRNGGAVFIYQGIYEPYWTTYNEQIGTVTNRELKKFLSTWNSYVNETNPYYNMFGVADAHDGALLLDGWTCFDYVWEAVHKLEAFGANFTVTQLKRNYANFYSLESPANITEQFYTDSKVQNEVVDFFKMLDMTGLTNMTAMEIIEAIVHVLDGSFYMRRSTDYYQIKLHYPYFRLSWVNTKL